MNWQTNSKTIHFKTFGCKVNQYETQVLRELFLKVGFNENSRTDSDIYIVNTCSLTKNTDRKVRQYIKEIKRLNPKAKIFVGGCGVFNPESGLENIKGIEIFKSKDKRGLFKRVVGVEDYSVDSICSFQGHERAFVKIQDGCDNLCSYCVIPYLRGRPVSRPKEEILTEIKNLVNNQFKEIVICGINLGAYGVNQDGNLIDLIRQILSIKKNFRLRLSSIEPNYVNQELINLMAENERLCPHFHLPLQSGDDEILKIMNRKYSIKEYFSLIDNIRKKVKDVSITSDVLVGFPQETEKNFKNTLKAIEKVRFLKTHIFSYSRRQLTPSAKLEGQLSTKTINERRKEAQKVAQKNSYLFRKKFINKTLPVLIEKRKNKETLRNFGFTNNYIEVQLEISDDLVNSIRNVKIIAVKKHENFAILSPKGQK
jgi:threonylcarbamoyladenosine tRNA methylthiotransferase MtaB